MTRSKCPFCGAAAVKPWWGKTEKCYRCGTTGPDENGEYRTGVVCEKDCVTAAYLRCHDLLVRVAAGPLTDELLAEIREEVSE